MNLAQAPIDRDGDGLVVSLGDAKIPIPDDVAGERGLSRWAGKPVIVGIRPEDLVGNPGDRDGRKPTLRGKLVRVEALGATLLGYFAVAAETPKARGVVAAAGDELVVDAPLVGEGGTLFCATFEPRSGIRAGNEVEIAVDVERLHFFDPETEAALGAGSTALAGATS
jgi:multiple sugar transport system ATP-binding protein